MSTQELRMVLHESIENIDDDDFLLAVKQIIDRKYSSAAIPMLSKEQINRIEESHEQIKLGKSFSNHDADLLVEKWLSE
ncbi:MAG: hypothetical protein HOO86_09915 [Bacteroidales bacterium]|nr:hypothetical protein [Bacteroidales bacterium]